MKKIAVFDIDGVLNYYPQTWITFINEMLKTNYKTLYEMKDAIPYKRYKQLKELYRTSGYKETLEIRTGADNLLQELRSEYFIILMTARPIERYNELLQQTKNWLNNNFIYSDFLYFSSTKHLDIIQKFKNISFMVEDNRYFANEVGKQGYKVFLLDNEYNQGDLNENVKRIKELEEIYDAIK